MNKRCLKTKWSSVNFQEREGQVSWAFWWQQLHLALQSVWHQSRIQQSPRLAEEQRFSSVTMLVSKLINLFKIQDLISQSLHQKKMHSQSTYLIRESWAAAILTTISLGFGKLLHVMRWHCKDNKNNIPFTLVDLISLSEWMLLAHLEPLNSRLAW